MEFVAAKADEFHEKKRLSKEDRENLIPLLKRFISEISPKYQFERIETLGLGKSVFAV